MSNQSASITLLVENFVTRWWRGRQANKMERVANKHMAKAQYFSKGAELRKAMNDHDRSSWRDFHRSNDE